MPTDQEELGVNLHARPFSDSVAGVPIKKRPFVLVHHLSSPSAPSSSSPGDCDKRQKSSDPGSSASEICNRPASGIVLTRKASSESVVCRDLNMDPGHKNLPFSNNQGTTHIMPQGMNRMNESNPGNIDMGSSQLLPPRELSEMHSKEGFSEGKYTPSDSSSISRVSVNTEFESGTNKHFGALKTEPKGEDRGKSHRGLLDFGLGERQENLENKCSDVGSTELSLNRSNWDLNTTMDRWDGSMSDSVASLETNGHDSSVLGCMHRKRIGSVPEHISHKQSDGADARNHVFEKWEHELKPSNSLASMKEVKNAEACLDLQLKPSFIAESFFRWGSTRPLGKIGSLAAKEMPILSLSVQPSSSCNLASADCTTVKVEPLEERERKDTRLTEVGVPKSADLKHIKSEPSEVQESSKKIDPRDLKSPHKSRVKSEAIENLSQGHLKGLDSCSLASQSAETPQNVLDKDSQTSIPDGKGMGNTNIIQDPDKSVGQLSSLDGHRIESHAKANTTESSDAKVELSAEVLDKQCDQEKEWNSSHDDVGGVVTADSQFNNGFLDGEVDNTTQGSCMKREKQPAKDSDSISSVDMPAEVTSCEGKIENLVESKIHGAVNPGISAVPNDPVGTPSYLLSAGHENDTRISRKHNLHESSAVDAQSAGSGKTGSRKIVSKIPRDRPKDKGIVRKPKPRMDLSVGEDNGVGSGPVVANVSCSSANVDAEKHCNENKKSNSTRIICLNPASNGVASGRTNYIPGRSLSSRIGKNRLAEKSFKRDKFRPQRFRDEHINQGPGAFGNKSKDEAIGRRGSNLMHIQRANKQLNGDRERILDEAESSRPISEVMGSISGGYNGRLQRNAQMACRRRSLEVRGPIPVGIQMVRHPMRDNRYIGREVPDFMMQNLEEMASFPDGMVVPPLFRGPCSRFEREEGSTSPIHRRGRVHNIPPGGTSHYQWSPPRRSPDGSPHRMRPTHQRPCFPQDMLVRRRRGSPTYHEHDFPRPRGGFYRNMQRVDAIGHQEVSDEDYFEVEPQFGDVEERHLIAHSFTQRGEDEAFRSHVESGIAPRPVRFCPESNTRRRRDCNAHIRNRLGSPGGRLRVVEEEEEEEEGSCRYDGEPGWSDDGRLKRIRFERH